MEKEEEKEITAEEVVQPKKQKLGIFARLRRRFSTILRRKKRKSVADSIPEEAPKPEEVPVPAPPVTEGPELITPPPKKAPVFLNDFTAELKTTLKHRSRDGKENEKSPTEPSLQMEIDKTKLATVIREEVEKIERTQDGHELKSFGEKLALFESQTSGGGDSSYIGSLSRSEKMTSRPVSTNKQEDIKAEFGDDSQSNEDFEKQIEKFAADLCDSILESCVKQLTSNSESSEIEDTDQPIEEINETKQNENEQIEIEELKKINQLPIDQNCNGNSKCMESNGDIDVNVNGVM